jgi:hypothetical protein
VNLLILAGVIAVVAADGQYYLNFLLGCQKIETSDLALLSSPTQRRRNFVTVHGDKTFRTGYQDIIKHVEKATGRVTSTEVKDEYILLKVGERALLVKAPEGPEKLDYSGELVPTIASVQSHLVQGLATDDPELGQRILPFTLNAADYREQGYWALGIGVPLVLLALWNCSKAFRRQSEVQTAPIWRSLAVFGDVQQLSHQIEAELMASVAQFGNLRVTRSWLINKNFFSSWVSPSDDLAWVYKKVTKHSVNFIPTGKTYAVVLVGRHRQRVEVQMKEAKVHSLLETLAKSVPWAIFGFDKQLDDAYRKDPGGLAAVVDSRRQQLAAKASAAPTTQP